MQRPKLILSSSGLGAGKKGAEMGPFALQAACADSNSTFFKDREIEVLTNNHLLYTRSSKADAMYLNEIAAFNERTCTAVAQSYKNHKKLVVLSGDHSNAVGSISGLCLAHPDKKIGVIWIDAHADLHSPYSSPTFNVHGMPLAALCGFDNKECKSAEKEIAPDKAAFWERLKNVGKPGAKLNASDLLFIDIRDLEYAEWDSIYTHGIRHYEPKDRHEKGTKKIISEVEKWMEDFDMIYISFDVDSLDPSISRGTGTPVPDGLSKAQASELLHAFYHHNKCAMLEITEINPLLDQENKMAKTVCDILEKSGIA